jgi:cysteine synthase A
MPPAPPVRSLIDLIGNTPLIRLAGPSEATGCTILGKAEFLNPGGSVKDRAALGILLAAEAAGQIAPGGTVVEGTAGNTGIGLAVVGRARGYQTVVVMPETQSQEKKDLLRALGTELILVPPAPYASPNHYVHTSRRIAEERGALWANQFDNVANREAHRTTTGVEIWEQTAGAIDGFTCAVGSGGTLAGVGLALKARNPAVTIACTDPMGASLYHGYTHGALKAEGNSVAEGIGQSRITANLDGAPVDLAFQVPDPEGFAWMYDLMARDGLHMGLSSGLNVAGAVRLARHLGPGKTIVTILCDQGRQYLSKHWNPAWLTEKGLPLPPWLHQAT